MIFRSGWISAPLLLLIPLLAACTQDARVALPGTGVTVPGQYIVALEPTQPDTSPDTFGMQGETLQLKALNLETTRVATALGVQHVGTLEVIGGFIAADVDGDALARLKADPRVRYVEADRVVRLSGTQTSATWGLDRIDQRSLPLNSSYRYGADGSGVTAYVIDTGIRKGHREFGGRLAGGVTAIKDGRGYNDCSGHGTHVAGTIGGQTYGVAKDVTLFAVRVFGCDGVSSNATIIRGIDWVSQNAKKPAVANLSFESDGSRALDEATRALVIEGVTVVVAAGNGSSNACATSPARVGNVLTVGASTRDDRLWEDTNYGPCVDLFAPGDDVTSAGLGSSLRMSGTSMAAPHVAGVAALVLEKNRSATPSTVMSRVKARTTEGKLRRGSSSSSGSPNRLLFSDF